VALAGLAVLTWHAARGGVWLALFAVPPAAAGFGGPARGARLHRLARPLAFALIVIAIVGIAHGPLASGAGPRMLQRTLALAHGSPVLAEDVLAEQVATEGGRVWMANPIDAFSARDQRVYVEWMRGLPPGDGALAHAPRAVLVRSGGKADRRLRANAAFRRIASDARTVLYARVAR
jgi:hypothetical protein